MEHDPNDLLLPPGMFGTEGKPALRLHPIERELHALTGAVLRMATAAEAIARDVATIRNVIEREAR